MYAMDAVATLAGLLLVATGVLRRLDTAFVLLFVGASYLVWWAGLRVNLHANWALLEATGTSTNLLSKAAYELARLRRAGARLRRVSASAGYVASELAKEAPYYAGAFGAAAVSDGVSANDALIFLAGANLGAAAYEYGLGRGIVAFLRGRRDARYAAFDTDWVPRDYLADYYSAVGADERRTIAFFVEAMKEAESGTPILLFGVGPTLHHVFLAVPKASEIHLGDYLPGNLWEIERWLAGDPTAHDWRAFVRYTLECEGIARPTPDQVAAREQLVRARAARLLAVDLRCTDPLFRQGAPPYATVISAYCADSATADRGMWEAYMGRIVRLVRPGGLLLVAALRRSHGYRIGGKTFPSANVDEHDHHTVLEPCCEPGTLMVETCELAAHGPQGYSGIVLARGRRRRTSG
jgi:hypothetical protein